MGYYTNYSIQGENRENDPDSDVDVTFESILETLRQENEEARYAFDESGDCNNNCKWYNAQSELVEFSKNYPGWLFTVRGEGEETGDMWVWYIMNGKVQEAPAIITYDEFDESKLV